MCRSQDWVQPNKYFLKIKLVPTARRFCAPVLLSSCFSPGYCLRPHPAPASMASPVTPGVLLRSGCRVADLPPRPESRPALLAVRLRHPCLQSHVIQLQRHLCFLPSPPSQARFPLFAVLIICLPGPLSHENKSAVAGTPAVGLAQADDWTDRSRHQGPSVRVPLQEPRCAVLGPLCLLSVPASP